MLSICVTNFNREHLLYRSIKQVLDHPDVTEIIISDDCSEYELYKRVVKHYKDNPKVSVSRTDTNSDCFRNKRRAVALATNEWVILLDSDNVIDKEYIDVVGNCIRDGMDAMLQPCFAKPHFNFMDFSGMVINRKNVGKWMHNSRFSTMLNAANYAFKRDDYLNCWDGSVDPVTSDTIWQNYCWLKSGKVIYVVPGLEYIHTVEDHGGEERSHYQKNNRRTAKGFHESVIKKLKELR